MPTRGRPDEILHVGVDLDAKAALQAMQKFQRAMKTEMQTVTKTVQNLEKVNKRALQEAVDGSKEWLDELDDLAVAHDKEATQLDKIGKQLDALRDKQEKLGGEAKKSIGEQIKLLEKQASTLSSRVSAKLVNKAATNKLRTNLLEGFQKGIDEAAPLFQSFFSKDLKGMIEAGTSSTGKLLGMGLRKGAAAAFKGATSLKERGSAMSQAGAAKGGMSGGAMSAMGGMLKMAGGLFGKLGPMLSMVAKLGPLLSTVSSVMLSVVKLFIDAEAQAKSFQNDLLATASTSEFLAKAGYDTDAAFDDLEATVHGIRDAAFDAKQNLDWGITAEQHQQVVNTLNQEGISLEQIGAMAKQSGRDVGAFTSELTHTSVAFSRAFGVPLQEINQMQADLMTNMGMNLQDTRLAFGQMTRAASESGIASNKFFEIIRGVSADLSLYNTRLDDAVKTLKLLGKVMNPREAQKFMQTAMQGMKNMGRQERLRMTLLTGSGKMANLVNRDIQRKQKGLAKSIADETGKSAEDIEKMLASGSKGAIADLIKQLPDSIRGSVQEGVMDLNLEKARGKKGLFGTSGAAANLGPAAALEAMQGALKRFGGGKTLNEGVGTIGQEMMADNLGISQEQLDQMVKFEASIDMERESLKNGLAEGNKEVIEKLSKAGMKTAQDIDKAGYDQIYDVMGDGQKKQLTRTKKVENYAKQQSELTKSMLDKLSTIVDWLMNELYNVLIDIYDGLLDLLQKFGLGKDRSLSEAQKNLRGIKTGKGEISKAIMAQDPNKAIAGTKLVQKLNEVLDQASQIHKDGGDKQIQDSMKAIESMKASQARGESIAGGSTWTKADEIKLKAAEEEVAGKKKILETEDKLIDQMGNVFDPDQWAQALKMGGASDAAVAAFQKKANFSGGQLRGSDIATQLQAAGVLTADDIDNTLRKLPTHGDATLSRKTIGLGKTADILKEGGYYSEEIQKSSEETASAVDEVAEAGARQHESLAVKFGPTFLRTKYRSTIQDAVLDAARTALFEFYLYSKMDAKDVVKFMSDSNMSIKDMAKAMGENGEKGGVAEDLMKPTQDRAPGNASGGLVTGINGGLATVRASAGEGLASIGKGERILPAGAGLGGGSLNIPINVNGVGGNDLARVIHAKVVDGIAEYKRRERFT